MTENQRREFSSRTPVNENPDHVSYRRGFVTRHQVSGWRFLMRRIASGVALHDARMLVDPLRTQSRAIGVGALLMITGIIGCLVFSWIRPGGVAGDDVVLADRSTSALYVRVGDFLHPVLNLTSARLIAGRPVDPKPVKSQALDRFPRGNLVGIPGAPERMVQNQTRDADWTVCDGGNGVTVIAGEPEAGRGRAADLPGGHGVLVSAANATWLLWDGRRSRIDITDTAVTSGLGLGANNYSAPQPISDGLFNAIPEAPALTVPPIPDAGQPPAFPMPAGVPVGAVVTSYAPDSRMLYYAVLPDGLQPVSAVLAALLRNSNSHGLDQPPRLSADQVARLPVSSTIDTPRYPATPIALVDRAGAPVTCVQWSQPAGAADDTATLLSGSALPLADSVRTVDLVSASSGGTAHRVALPRGTGYFVQTNGGGDLFWVSDTGVRYGLDAESGSVQARAAGPATSTIEALGLTPPPLSIPSAVLSLFAPGPTLSHADALIIHDGLAPDPQAGRRIQETR